MKIGTVKEIKRFEFRVGLTPDSVSCWLNHGHDVFVETEAGLGAGFEDSEYIEVGATIMEHASDVWQSSDMIVKVKEPLDTEFQYLRSDLILFTYLHLAANKALTEALLEAGTISFAYETIAEGKLLPCLKPMSEIAGRLSGIEGAKHLEKHEGGRGILVSGVPGAYAAQAVIIGAGIVGENALKMLVGLGAHVTILDINLDKLTYLDQIYGQKIQTLFSNETHIKSALKTADLVIGAVLLPGSKAPKLIKKSYYKFMKQGAVIVDVAIDQGGSTEVSHATYHDDPTYVVDGILHYAVANMPGSVPRTATEALNHATLKYGLRIADLGHIEAINKFDSIKLGLNTAHGDIHCQGVAEAFNMAYKKIS
ncbi:alanine dehydrogenase [Mycoplasmatota bacterium]|nr:alanine dehydrogenase [Mycoplasmatota bacterium]